VSADNTYTEEEVVDLFLAAFTQTQNIQYMYVTQHFMSLRQSDAAVAFHDIEKRLMAIDETTARSCFVARKSRDALSRNVSRLTRHRLDVNEGVVLNHLFQVEVEEKENRYNWLISHRHNLIQ